MKTMHKLFVGLISVLVITSCASTYSSLQPEVVSRADAQKQQYVVFGVVRDTNRVIIEGDREVGASLVQPLVEKLVKRLPIQNQSKILQQFWVPWSVPQLAQKFLQINEKE